MHLIELGANLTVTKRGKSEVTQSRACRQLAAARVSIRDWRIAPARLARTFTTGRATPHFAIVQDATAATPSRFVRQPSPGATIDWRRWHPIDLVRGRAITRLPQARLRMKEIAQPS